MIDFSKIYSKLSDYWALRIKSSLIRSTVAKDETVTSLASDFFSLGSAGKYYEAYVALNKLLVSIGIKKGDSLFRFTKDDIKDYFSRAFDTTINKLGDIRNVDDSDVEDDWVLKYDKTTAKWVVGKVGSLHNLIDHGDVDASGLADGRIFKYNASTGKWDIVDEATANYYVSSMSWAQPILTLNRSGLSALTQDLSHNLTDSIHPDVQVASLAVDNVLKWDGAHWVNKAGNYPLISGTPAVNQVVIWSAADQVTGNSALTFDGSKLSGNNWEIDGDGNAAYGATIDTNKRLKIYQNAHGKINSYFIYTGPAVTSDTTNYDIVHSLVFYNNYNIPSGITDSGYRIGLDINAYIDTSDFAGTINNQYGGRIQYGHHTNATGGGTINNAYGLFLDYLTSGNINVTNAYSIYSTGAAKMYHEGYVGIGKVPTQPLDISGNVQADANLKNPSFTSGWQGTNWMIWSTGDAEFNDVKIRGGLSVYELIINQLRYQDGGLIIGAGGGKLASVTGSAGGETITVEDPEGNAIIPFTVGAIVMVQRFDLDRTTAIKKIVRKVSTIVSSNIGLTTLKESVNDEQFTSNYDTPVSLLHQNLVSGLSNVTTIDGGTTYTEGTDYTMDYVNGTITVLSTGTMLNATAYYIDYQYETWPVSSDTGILAAGDDMVTIGHVSDTNYDANIYMSAVDSGNPFLRMFDGVDSYAKWSLGDKSALKLQIGNLESLANWDVFGDGSFVMPASPGYGLYSNNVYLAGKIVANSGNVGGWDITSGYLMKDTGIDATSAGLSPGDFPFYAGATYANRAIAPFRVTPAGVLTATSGTIGGWSLDTDAIYHGTKHTTNGYANAVGDLTLSADGSVHTLNFYVDADGDVGFRGKQIIYAYIGVSDIVIIGHSSPGSTTSTTYVKVDSITLGSYIRNTGLTLRITFGLSSTNGDYVYGAIKRTRGSTTTDVGVEKFTNSTTSTLMSQDISDWQSGDIIELWLRVGTSGDQANADNFDVRGTLAVAVNEVTEA